MATTFDLSVIFRAIDKMSVPMSRMQKKMAVFSEKAKKMGQSLQNVGRSMTMFVTLPIIAAGTAMIKTASDMAESINKVDVAFGDSAQFVKDWSNTTLKSFGIAKGTALDMAALFGDMGTAMGFNQEAAANMSTELVGLAGDLASFKNINIDIAKTALTSIFTGETESLKKLGIVMTEVNLEEFARSQGIQKSIKNMTQAEKVQLRYNYVLKMTINSQGDFIRTGGGAANQMRIFIESLKELAANFGEIILPIFTKFITKLNKIVQWFGNLNPKVKKTILIIMAITAAIGPLLFVVGKLISMIGMAGKAFQVLRLLLTPQGLIIMGIVAAITLLIIIILNWGKISTWLMDKWKKLVNFIQRMPRIIFILLKILTPFIWLPVLIIRNWEKIKPFFVRMWEFIINLFSTVGGKLGGFFVGLWEGIVNAFVTAIEFIKDIWKSFTEWAMKNPVLKWLFEIKPKKQKQELEKKAEITAQEIKKKEDEKKKKNLFNMDNMFKDFKNFKGETNTVFVNVKVSAEEGSLATVDKVNSTGKMKKKVQTDSKFTGVTH